MGFLLLSILLTPSRIYAQPPASGLIGLWTFDEGVGNAAYDYSGKNNNGTVNGAAWVAGYDGMALNFNGTTNSVVTNSIALTQSFSISAWVNSSAASQTAFGRIAETQYMRGFYLGANASAKSYKFIVNGANGTTGTCGAQYGCAEGGTISSGWHLVTGTYDGSMAVLYVDGVEAASDTFTAPANVSLPLYIGRYYAANGYGWNGAIDEVRLYNRALSSTEAAAIYGYVPSNTPPSVPGNVQANAVSSSQITVTWSASSDPLGVSGYQVYRDSTLIAATPGLSFTDSGLTASTTYSYSIAAYDLGGNVSAQSSPPATTTTLGPSSPPPTVSITQPSPNSMLSGTQTVSATASASSGLSIASVQFQLDGNNLGSAVTAAPYSVAWDTTTTLNGSHTLTAIAKDSSGSMTTSAGVMVTVSNPVGSPPTGGLVGYWTFDAGVGTTAYDSSGSNHNGTVNGAAWVAGYNGPALKFNGSTNSVVTNNIALAQTFSISAWVNPTVLTQIAYARIAETQYNQGFYLGLNGGGTGYQFIVNNGAGATGSCGAAYGCAQGGTVKAGWHLITATYDGSTAVLYVDGAQVGTETFAAPLNANLPLYIARYYGGTGYGWNGAIDEVRLYNRALTSTEVAAVYDYVPSNTPPSVPGNVQANPVSSSQITVTWSASSDPLGVSGYQVYRDSTLIAATPGLSFTDSGLTPSTTYSYSIAAYDAGGNVSAQSSPPATTTTLGPSSPPPTVSITQPSPNSMLSGTQTVSATASASSGLSIASVQFQLDGNNLGSAVTAAPYNVAWDTSSTLNGSHTLTAIAKDSSGSMTTSAGVMVTVSNPAGSPPTGGLIGYWTFDAGVGTTAYDSSGSNHNGSVNGAAWVAGYNGPALKFNGSTNSVVTNNIALAQTFSISAWVNPTVLTQIAYARIAETQYNVGLSLGVSASGTSYKFIVNNGAGARGSCGASFGCAQGGTVKAGWHLVTATYDGSTAVLYVDGAQVATETFTAPLNTNLPLYIARYYGGTGYGWNGAIDELRLYNRALSSTEVAAIYGYVPSNTPPTVPGDVTASAASPTQVTVNWTNSMDALGVVGYQVYRNGTLVAATAGLSYIDSGLVPGATYSYTVAAYDNGGNVSAQSSPAATATTPGPAISLLAAEFVTPSGATIVWTTNEPANSQVVWGLNASYGDGPITSSSMSTSHGILINGLQSATTYHFQVQSTDPYGNTVTSADQVFTTAAPSQYAVGWTQLPNTMMNSVCPPNGFHAAQNYNYPFATECWRLLVWGGAIADTLRNRMLIWGGGHDNYYGNEIYSLNLNANPVTLTRLNDPGPVVQPEGNNCATTLADGSPNARETQNNIVYMANLDLLFSFNGALACEPGTHANDTWTLSLGALQWRAMDPVNGPINANTYGQYFSVGGYDPINQNVYEQWQDALYLYTYSTNTYTQLSTAGGAHFPTYATGVIDPKRQLFIAFGTEYQDNRPYVYAIDLTGAGNYASVQWTSRVTGCDGLASARYPGLVYDYALDQIVGYPNAGNTVYIFNPDTMSCTTQTFDNGPQATLESDLQGTFGRFQYFPSLDVFAIVNAADDNAYLLRLAPVQ
ncbi:MAG TPA: LamG-like jellyroll fold domain-containing protein [Bryobacteraceae bacterium]|nr:LamG-like jellyroll fold domain-containing protein [Bryobacteraceae bacterium]